MATAAAVGPGAIRGADGGVAQIAMGHRRRRAWGCPWAWGAIGLGGKGGMLVGKLYIHIYIYIYRRYWQILNEVDQHEVPYCLFLSEAVTLAKIMSY